MALRDALLNGLDGLCGYPRSAAFRVVECLAAAGALDEPSVFVHALGDGNDMDAKVWTSGVGGEVPDEVQEAFAQAGAARNGGRDCQTCWRSRRRKGRREKLRRQSKIWRANRRPGRLA